MSTMNYNLYGTNYEIVLRPSRYTYGDNLAISMFDYNEEFRGYEPFGSITVNISDVNLPENYACVDTNNLSQITDFIEKYGLGEDTGLRISSGFCEYPVYKFDMDKVREYSFENQE